GQETIEGNLAWHIEVVSKSDATLGFWIDAAHPDRVLKVAYDGDSVVSRYDAANLRDPLPLEMTVVSSYRNRPLSSQTRITRANARINVPIDPDSFTIAGLGMPIGTPVTDIRAYRNPDRKTYTGLGYWTGAGLAEFPPPKGAAPPKVRQLPELLALLDMDPTSAEALDAAIWIVRNTADGPDVEKAGDALLKYHVRATNLVELCRDLERLRHRCSRPLLEAILSENPSAAVRGPACFELARWRKGEARFGRDAKATAEAEGLFERVITDFGQVKYQGWRLEQLARPELSELRRLSIGK